MSDQRYALSFESIYDKDTGRWLRQAEIHDRKGPGGSDYRNGEPVIIMENVSVRFAEAVLNCCNQNLTEVTAR